MLTDALPPRREGAELSQSAPPPPVSRYGPARARAVALTREEETELAERIRHAERDLVGALLTSFGGARELGKVRSEVAAGQLALSDLLRTMDGDGAAATGELTCLSAALTASGATRINALAELRLHPRILDRLEGAARTDVDATTIARIRDAKARARAAKEELFARSASLVQSIASRYRSRHLAVADLVQEGNIGLLHAIDKFDPAKGCRLRTYASFWVKQGILRAIAEKAPTIRVPIHLADSRSRVRRAHAAIARESAANPSAAALSERSGVPLPKVQAILALAPEPASLDTPLDGGAATFADRVVNTTSPLPEDEAADAQLRARAVELLSSLSERERRVLHSRFGLDGAPERTLEEIGLTMELTRERVRQIEMRALAKLRATCEARAFRPEFRA